MGTIKSIKLLLASILGLLLFTWACDIMVKQVHKKIFPETGTSPLPAVEDMSYKTNTTIANNSVPALEGNADKQKQRINWQKIRALLLRTQAQTGDKYAAFYSLRDSSRGLYYYRTTALSFSPEAIKKAEGETRPFLMESSRSPNSPIELFAAVIPDSRLAVQELIQWITAKQKTPQTVVRMQRRSKTTEVRIAASNCYRLDRIIRYYSGGPPGEGGDLIKVVYVFEETSCGAGGGGGGDPTGGGGSTGDVPCEQQPIPGPECGDGCNQDGRPPYEPCWEGGGGGGSSVPPCERDNPPDRCVQVEPCDTNGQYPVLDDSEVQAAMAETWLESYGSQDNPLPDDQRSEATFLVYSTSSGYDIEIVPPGPGTSSCHFDGGTYSITSNIVAIVHLHPYSDGDTVNDPDCGSGSKTYDGDEVSDEDRSIVQEINSSTILPPTPMFVIDKDKIRIIKPSNPYQYSDSIGRCGY